MEKILMGNNGMTVYQEKEMKQPGGLDARKNTFGNAVSGACTKILEKAKALFIRMNSIPANKVKREPRFPLENLALAIVSIIVSKDDLDA